MTEVTTVIRVHSPACTLHLKRALFSLSAQKVDVFPTIVTQRFTREQTDTLKHECSPYQFGAIKELSFTNVEIQNPFDLRSRLLNVGVAKANKRYLHFLDFDDIMYGDAYIKLTNVLATTRATIAFGGIVSTYFESIGGRPYIKDKRIEYRGLNKYDLFVDNFCPLHSFVIDLSKTDKDQIVFDESMTALEDYSFLLGFLANHEADFSLIKDVVGEYFKRDADTINLARDEYPDPNLKLSKLQKARETILHKKGRQVVKLDLASFPGL